MIESVEVVIRQPGFPDRVVALHEGATRIGRSEDNELVLSDVGVSRRHAQVYWSGSECLIEDLGSGNGTYHRGQRVQSHQLADGDEVVIDPFLVLFRIRGGDARQGGGQAAGAGARLDVIVGTGLAGASYPIMGSGLSIGRAEDRDVVIPDPAASRHHCQISKQGERYFLKDMGSANGVFVNAVRVREQPLEDGDIVCIGNTEMRFALSSGGAVEPITQVGQTVQPQPSYGGHAVVPSTAPPAATRKGSSVWLWLTAFATLAAMGALLLVLAIALLYVFAYETAPSSIPAHSTTWVLELPAGLEGGTTDSMFKSGVEKMKAEDHLGALQDFYRVLQADPASRNAKKFALAAGEVVVLDALEGWLVDEAKAAKQRESRRVTLLARARRTGRTARAAVDELEENYREDPVVVTEMGWKPTEAMVKRQEAVKSAATALASEDYARAVLQYDTVLETSRDSAERMQALAGQKTCRRELGRAVAAPWRSATMSWALGDTSSAKSLFEVVIESDPTNPSASLRLQ